MTDFAFTYNGYTFGGAGSSVQIAGVQGLEDAPAVRTSDEPRGFADGYFYGRDFLGSRTVTVDLLFLPPMSGTFRAELEAAKAALIPQGGASTAGSPLQFTLPGLGVRRINCRLRRRVLPITRDYQFAYAPGSVEFVAADPRIYDDAAQTLSIGLTGAAPSGLQFPLTFPLSFGGATTPNTQVATNAGTFATKPVLTIQGPVDTPVVQNVTQGKSLRFNLTLAANDLLTVDTDVRSVVLNGTASRRSALSNDSVWWDLQPGANTITYSAAANSASTVALMWRNAYL